MLSVLVLLTGLTVWFRPAARERRRIGATKMYKAADLPEVTVGRLIGTARAIDGKTITSPVSGKPCLVYSVIVSANVTRKDVEVIFEETVGVRFALEDDTGSVIVEPERANCTLGRERQPMKMFPTLSDLSASQRELLARHGTSHPRQNIYRWQEGIVEAGETIAVVGFGQRGPDGVMTMSSSPRLPLTISDHRATTKTNAPEIPDARVVK
ncbi:MAG TPA: GIDE domain-containing protein [Kofleriaceae bacterium]|nr:GIDE domain-containing protein [Kofleriaceae bacterium]